MPDGYEAIGFPGEPGYMATSPPPAPTGPNIAQYEAITTQHKTGEDEDLLQPYEVLVQMQGEGATEAQMLTYVQAHPDAARGRGAKIARDAGAKFEGYEDLSEREQFALQQEMGFIEEGAGFAPGLSVDWSKSGLTPAEIKTREASMMKVTGRTSMDWGYLTAGQVAEQAAYQAALHERAVTLQTQRAEKKAILAPLSEFKVDGGYNLAGAFGAGLGADVYAAKKFGLFSTEQVLESQFGQIKASSLERAQADIARITPAAVTIKGKQTFVDLSAALAGGVTASTLRLAGFSPKDVAAAAPIVPIVPDIVGDKATGGVLPRYTIGEYTGEPPGLMDKAKLWWMGITPWKEEKQEGPIDWITSEVQKYLSTPLAETPEGHYAVPHPSKTWKGQEVARVETPTQTTVKLTLASGKVITTSLKEYDIQLAAWGSSWVEPTLTTRQKLRGWAFGKREEESGVAWTPGEILAAPETTLVLAGLGQMAATPSGTALLSKVPLLPQVAAVTTKGVGWMKNIALATTAGATAYGAIVGPREVDVSKYAIDVATRGTTESYKPLEGFVDPEGNIDVSGMIGRYGEAETSAILAQAGLTPTIPREVYEKLSSGQQIAYTSAERRSLAYEPGIFGAAGRGGELLLEPVDWLREKGLVGKIGAGMLQYFAPITMATELYPTRGPVAAITLVPHFGATWGYTALTWKEQSVLGRTLGIGMGFLPYAVGPAGSAFRWGGGVVSKVPVIGPVFKTVGGVLKWSSEAISPVTGALERIAPWQTAYAAGRLVPGYGSYAYGRGWLGPTESYATLLKRWGGQTVFPSGSRMTAAELKAAQAVPREQAALLRRLQKLPLTTYPKGPRPGDVAYPYEQPVYGAIKGKIYGYEKGVSWIKGSPYSGEPAAYVAPPAIIQQAQVGIPRSWGQISTTLTQAVKAAPSLLRTQPYIKPALYTAAVLSPLILLAAPAVSAIATPAVSGITDSVAVVETPTLAKIDIATVNQMLRQELITPPQHQEIIGQIQRLQTQEVAPLAYQQQIQTTIQQQLNTVQQSQLETVEQQVVQEQAQEIQQQIVQEQQRLQEMQQQQVQQWRLQQQQVTIQQLQQDYDFIIRQQEITEAPPTTPPPTIPIIPFILPIGLGAAKTRGSSARGRRGRRGRYEKVMWPFGELFISMPDPFGGQRKKTVIRKKGKKAFGGKTPTAKFKGIRL